MNPEAIYKTFIETGTAMAEAGYAHQQLDDQTKSILAQNTILAKDVEGVGSMAEAKEIALSASNYRDHLEDVAKAKMVFEIAKVKYYATRSLFDAKRTVEASSRVADRVQA